MEKKRQRKIELSRMNMKDYPLALKVYITWTSSKIGLSGDVIYDCIADYVDADEPEEIMPLIIKLEEQCS